MIDIPILLDFWKNLASKKKKNHMLADAQLEARLGLRSFLVLCPHKMHGTHEVGFNELSL